MPVDPKTVGQDRQYADPADAERAAGGVYSDRACTLPEAARLPNAGPRAPQPQPLGTAIPVRPPGE